jgi:multidrug transporter EmrE-like cation transporter
MDRLLLIGIIQVSVALNASAQILLRWGAQRGFAVADGASLSAQIATLLRPGVIAGLACYAISVVIWIYVLSRAEASFAYPFLGLGFVLVSLAGWQFLGEPLTIQRVAGTLLVSVGVFVLATS